MAQILKKEIREKIIASTKEEILNKGIKESSLREIALKSGVTVGNLYRYFKSKDDIIDTIINPTLYKLNTLIKEVTNNRVSFEDESLAADFDIKDIKDILDNLACGLAKLYVDNRVAMIILIKYSKNVEYIKKWFANVVSVLIKQNNHLNIEYQDLNNELSRTIASSVIAGIEECLLSKNLSENEIEMLLKIYFRAFVSMIEMK